MKRILISQPMGDKSAEEVISERKNLVSKLENLGYEILDNVFTDEPTDDVVNTNIYYLSKAIKLMTQADKIVFMNGWEKSRGCRIEMEIASKYNIPYVFECRYINDDD